MDKMNPIIIRITGSILFLVGIGFVVSSLWIIIGQFALLGTVRLNALPLVLGLGLISFFCIVVGYRLTFNRPNKYGSILSPISWIVLGLIFGVFGLGIIISIIFINHFPTRFISVAIFSILFAAVCWYAGSLARKQRLK
jgi:hypothetical protein